MTVDLGILLMPYQIRPGVALYRITTTDKAPEYQAYYNKKLLYKISRNQWR